MAMATRSRSEFEEKSDPRRSGVLIGMMGEANKPNKLRTLLGNEKHRNPLRNFNG